MKEQPRFLVETALLTHGLPSVSDDELLQTFDCTNPTFAWIDQGRLVFGNIQQFMPFRSRAMELLRIDHVHFNQALSDGLSGALTASGTMAACTASDITVAVSCGIGGIFNDQICSDLPALSELPVALIATSPKDMMDISKTICYLTTGGVNVYGYHSNFCNGFMFVNQHAVEIEDFTTNTLSPHTLLLVAIPEQKRLTDHILLKQAVSAGIAAKQNGGYFHPSVNAALDKLSAGQSSRLQLDALHFNITLATKLA